MKPSRRHNTRSPFRRPLVTDVCEVIRFNTGPPKDVLSCAQKVRTRASASQGSHKQPASMNFDLTKILTYRACS